MLHHLQSLIHVNEQRISQLEEEITRLQHELTKLSKEKKIHIDKLEYHFDQLKVDTLEGTLNIGLSTKSLEEQIEDLTVNGEQIQTDFHEEEKIKEMLAQFDHYFACEFGSDVERLSKQYGVPIDPSFYPLIKDQIQKQLSDRVVHYMQQAKQLETNDQHTKDYIFTLTKQDILTAIEQFLRQYPKGEG